MVFFNYSTMQMAAKIVYYGPGLCGKTTNLQHIYGRTSNESRGEMVSLETDTDRTLFFDLLPIDVGTIQGFNTRIQLYTVPGQVFYNTTRKLVLKGVDGVVFVADSQRAMRDTNVESFNNLEQNLQEIGLSVDEIPLVLQYNKRDLQDILSVEELNASLNRGDWPYFEASALKGAGVFETLKGISKLTLLSLKKRILEMQGGAGEARVAAPAPKAPAPPAEQAAPEPPANQSPAPAPPPSSASAQAEDSMPAAEEPAADKADTSAVREESSARPKVDILAELEKIRRRAKSHSNGNTAPEPAAATAVNGSLNGDEASADAGDLFFDISRPDIQRTRSCSISLRLEDDDAQVLDTAMRNLPVRDVADLNRLLTRLNEALETES